MTNIVIELYEFTTVTKANSLAHSINLLMVDEESVKEIRIE
jgi:hypothetical protein